jgi:hypothetical protein
MLSFYKFERGELSATLRSIFVQLLPESFVYHSEICFCICERTLADVSATKCRKLEHLSTSDQFFASKRMLETVQLLQSWSNMISQLMNPTYSTGVSFNNAKIIFRY